jgi:predicted pyridoxine 5'-phosphate oxidase superfamily flavin-nucleotide-binding protein
MRLPEHNHQFSWHTGEVAIQRTVGVAERLARHGPGIIRDYLPEQHRNFYPQLPFVVLGGVDASGDAWATLRAGEPGFVHSPDPSVLRVESPRDPSDPADTGLDDGNAIALLGIELSTRRRNRVNGSIRRSGPGQFDIQVEQAFGNCPKYIQVRDFEFLRDPASLYLEPAQPLIGVDERVRSLITGADTFFVASYIDRDGWRQVDVSHRGGKPGFVRLDDDGVLTIPDFTGNRFFNTLGNLLVNPKAGLVFVDFDTGDLLQLSGDAEVLLDSPETALFLGAERFWRFTPRRFVYRAKALPLRWTLREWSPNSLATGDWAATAGMSRAGHGV